MSCTGVAFDEAAAVSYHCPWDENYIENPERFNFYPFFMLLNENIFFRNIEINFIPIDFFRIRSVLRRCEELGLIERCVKIFSRLEDLFLKLKNRIFI
jgi:hypothetical protein